MHGFFTVGSVKVTSINLKRDGAIAPGVVISEVLRAVVFVISDLIYIRVGIANFKVKIEAVAFFDTFAVGAANSVAVILSPEVVVSFPEEPGLVRTNEP